ncbi:hypothetical protein J4423_02930 [Candidatus Pacearchaeota archaeon]|nr:hypothetical protein [Candidatus Pacearchaeota archaeon]
MKVINSGNKKAGVKNNFSLYLLIALFFISFLLIVSAQESEGEGGGGSGSFINLISPYNNSINLDGNLAFSYSLTNTSLQIDNCSLIFNEVVNQTDSNVTFGVTHYFYLNNLINGNYNWSVECNHANGNISNSEVRGLEVFIDTTPPAVMLVGPPDSSTDANRNVALNYSVTDNGYVTKCDLYTDINGTWAKNKSNIFVQQNATLSFEVENIPDDTTFDWNVVCYDFASTPNLDWGNSNLTLTIDNSDPTYSTIPNQNWAEDSYLALNLSNYFSDPDGHNLTYSSTSPSNISVEIDGSLATLRSDANWYGATSIVFYAFDSMGGNASSNSVSLAVTEAGDTPPGFIYTSPEDYYNDTDGFVTITCNATDDYSLNSISLYTDTTGVWHENQTGSVSGTENSTTFYLTNLEEGNYNWACKFDDGGTLASWSENKTFDFKVTVELEHDINNYTINHVDHNRTVAVIYSDYLGDSLDLGDLTIYLSNGSIYFTKNMSESSEFISNSTEPPLNIHAEKFRIKYDQIFYGNFTVGNEEWLNISLDYYYGGNLHHISTIHTMEVRLS